MTNRNILHHIISVNIIGDTAKLNTRRLSQAAFKNAYTHYAAIGKELKKYNMPQDKKLIWRTQHVEDLVDNALERYGMRVARGKSSMEFLKHGKLDVALHMALEDTKDE